MVRISRSPLNVIVSSGSSGFHMSMAAAEADASHILDTWYCSMYPTPRVRKVVKAMGLDRFSRMRKLLGRAVDVDVSRLHQILLPELVLNMVQKGRRVPLLQHIMPPTELSAYMTARAVARHMAHQRGHIDIYHYRAGFGGPSLKIAKQRGAVLLCDHSIAHPLVLEHLIASGGRLDVTADRASLPWLQTLILQDIEAADHVLVNSDFVRSSFDFCGYDTSKVSVIYQGVDDAFFHALPERLTQSSGPRRILFAGAFCKRKGADVLLQALKALQPVGWSFATAGSIAPEYIAPLNELMKTCPVSILGNLDRATLAREMARADIFVFPSLAEGSARVIFEAMAAGCYVITTPNAGSIVEDGGSGRLVPTGDVAALAEAMNFALQDKDISKIQVNNSNLISNKYRQKNYGEKIISLYEQLLGARI